MDTDFCICVLASRSRYADRSVPSGCAWKSSSYDLFFWGRTSQFASSKTQLAQGGPELTTLHLTFLELQRVHATRARRPWGRFCRTEDILGVLVTKVIHREDRGKVRKSLVADAAEGSRDDLRLMSLHMIGPGTSAIRLQCFASHSSPPSSCIYTLRPMSLRTFFERCTRNDPALFPLEP